jgi:hypothetical protein
LLIGLLLLCIPGLAPAESTVVSRQLCNGLWLVPLTWQGESGEPHALTAVFDTGGSSLFIDPDALERFSGQRVAEGRRVRMQNVSASGIEFSTFRPRVREMSHLGAALGIDFDVFLPYPAFDGKLLVLDYPAMEMRIEDGTLPAVDGERIFSAAGPDDRPWLRVEFPDRPRRVLIDSGSNGRLELKRLHGLQWAGEPIVAGVSTRMDKVVMRRAGRVEETLSIANLEFEQPIVSITGDTELMGVEVLRHFVLSFDIAQRRVRFEPASAAPVRMPPERDTGALLRADVDGHYEVVRILSNTPAERAGLSVGDRVVEIDGVAVAERGCRALDDVERPQVIYGIERGGSIERLALDRIAIIE